MAKYWINVKNELQSVSWFGFMQKSDSSAAQGVGLQNSSGGLFQDFRAV